MNHLFTANDHAIAYDHIVRIEIQGRIRITWMCETVDCPANHMYPMTKRGED